MRIEGKNVNWRFLVPLLDLTFPVYQALVTSLNHSNRSPRSRMNKFLDYLFDTFDFVDVTDSSGLQDTKSKFFRWKYGSTDISLDFYQWPEETILQLIVPPLMNTEFYCIYWSVFESKFRPNVINEGFHHCANRNEDDDEDDDEDEGDPKISKVEFLEHVYDILLKHS